MGQERSASAINAAGRGSNLTGLRTVVRANLKTRVWDIQPNGATNTGLANQDIEAVALFLATAGYGPEDVAPGKAGGAALIESAGRIVLGGSDLADEIRVAPVVVVADLVSVEPSSTADTSYRSTATLRVVESLKGGLAAGAMLRLRQRSGPADGSYIHATGEFEPHQTGRYLLFVSAAAYEVRSGRKTAATHIIQQSWSLTASTGTISQR